LNIVWDKWAFCHLRETFCFSIIATSFLVNKGDYINAITTCLRFFSRHAFEHYKRPHYYCIQRTRGFTIMRYLNSFLLLLTYLLSL